MKITKKARKKINGMNAITLKNYNEGHSVPVFRNIAGVGKLAQFVKTKKGVPYVNANNFV